MIGEFNFGFYFSFHELQIYGNSHLAIKPEPFEEGATLHFQHMIGDRSGHIHVGPFQSMDLQRDFIDTPFNTYVYEGGYLGLGVKTEIHGVFVDLKGTMDHIVDLVMVNEGYMNFYQTGSTNQR